MENGHVVGRMVDMVEFFDCDYVGNSSVAWNVAYGTYIALVGKYRKSETVPELFVDVCCEEKTYGLMESFHIP